MFITKSRATKIDPLGIPEISSSNSLKDEFTFVLFLLVRKKQKSLRNSYSLMLIKKKCILVLGKLLGVGGSQDFPLGSGQGWEGQFPLL